jgi:hypothetical protein
MVDRGLTVSKMGRFLLPILVFALTSCALMQHREASHAPCDRPTVDGCFQTIHLNSRADIASMFGAPETLSLDKAADFLRDHKDIQVSIEGHAPSSGNVVRDLDHAYDIAKYVREALAKRGIDENRLGPLSYGSERPLESNPKSVANLRVEIFYLDPLGGSDSAGAVR